ncbi:hypothetical protein K1719_013794 [Acacia pycnantha]|nr:hypothetical protein K1719_013794 [Acacia pycnantha]
MSNNDNEIEAALQHMLELLYSQASDHLSSDHFQQQHDVEDDGVTLDMKEMIQDYGDGALLSEYCIYKVPHILRHLNEDAYTPRVVSIGPFHHEPKVRASYLETIDLTEHQLVKLTLRDAGYIIQLFIMTNKIDEVGNDDAKLIWSSLAPNVFQDLLLLENQLPFFVIEELFNKAFPHNSRESLPSFLELTYRYFHRLSVEKLEPNDDVEIKHFTDLLRFFYLQGKSPTRRHLIAEAGRDILRYNASTLQEKGIKLEASDSNCLLDMKFSRNTLEIPKILVEASTKLLFHNMIGLEQYCYPDHAYISDYAHILDCLVDTSNDVDLLVSKKIVTNYLGDSNKVASLFNRLGGNVTLWDFNSEYLDICKKLNDNFQDRWIERMATLRRDHCRTPWKIVATIAGIVVILLTVVQTIISILQVGK